jgi:hypothetical protein
VLALALCTGLSALAGDIHATYMICLAGGVLAVVRAGGRVLARDISGALGAILSPLAGMTAGMLLAAVAVIPAIEVALLSERSTGANSYSSYHSMDPKAILGWFLPGFFGAAHDGTVWNFRAGNAVFVGLVTLAMAAWSLRKPLESLPLVAMFAAGVALALGAYNPAWYWFQKLLPGLRYFRQPREWFVIAVLAAIVLAARGLSGLLERPRSAGQPRRGLWKAIFVLSAAGCLAAVLVASNRDYVAQVVLSGALVRYADGAQEISRRMVTSVAEAALVASLFACALAAYRLGALSGIAAAAVTGALVLADFGVASWGSLVFGPAELCSGRTAMADTLRDENRGAFVRIVPAADGFGEYYEDYGSRRLGGRLKDEPADMPTLFKVKSCLVDNEPTYAGISSALGYSTFVTRRYAALWRASGASEVSPVRLRYSGPGKYWLFGANYILDASRNWDSCTRARIDAADIRMVYHWLPAKNFDEAVTLVSSSPERAYLTPVVEGIRLQPEAAPFAEVKHSIESIARGANVLTLRVFTDGPGVLYIPDANYPGWKAWDNGAPTRIYDANIAFRAIYLTAGKHDVELRFSPGVFYWGGAASAAAVVAGAVCAIGCMRGKGDE